MNQQLAASNAEPEATSGVDPTLAQPDWHAIHVARAARLHREEAANALTHAIGAILALAGGISLVVAVRATGNRWQIAACTIYAAALVGVYLASALSHLFHHSRLRRPFRMLDQGFIFLLIAGTFTPPAVTYLPAGWWWLVPAALWTIAIYGFFSKVGFAHKVEAVSPRLHLLMGWLPVLTLKPFVAVAPAGLFWWFLAGGLCYSLGTYFLCRDHRPYHHAIWHVFVIAGSVCHFVAIWQYCLAPLA